MAVKSVVFLANQIARSVACADPRMGVDFPRLFTGIGVNTCAEDWGQDSQKLQALTDWETWARRCLRGPWKTMSPSMAAKRLNWGLSSSFVSNAWERVGSWLTSRCSQCPCQKEIPVHKKSEPLRNRKSNSPVLDLGDTRPQYYPTPPRLRHSSSCMM